MRRVTRSLLGFLCVPLTGWGVTWLVGRVVPEPGTEFPSAHGGPRVALVLSEDGSGRRSAARLAGMLADGDIAVLTIGVRSGEGPRDLSEKVAGVMRRQRAQWRRDEVILVGLPPVGGFVPFVANRLPSALREQLTAIVLVQPEDRVTLRRSWRGVFRSGPVATGLPVAPELERLRGARILCLDAADDPAGFCASRAGLVRAETMKAGGLPTLAARLTTLHRP